MLLRLWKSEPVSLVVDCHYAIAAAAAFDSTPWWCWVLRTGLREAEPVAVAVRPRNSWIHGRVIFLWIRFMGELSSCGLACSWVSTAPRNRRFIPYSRRKKAKGQHDWSGDLWTWTAIDRDSKLLLAWVTGDRGADEARYLMSQLEERIKGKIRLTTDGWHLYADAISWAGMSRKNLEYAKIVKVFAGVKDYPTDPDSRRNRLQRVGDDVGARGPG